MAFDLPTFAEMKGHAVHVMNVLVKQPTARPDVFPFQFPVELRQIKGVATFLVNGTSGVVWKQGIPASLVRSQDSAKPHNDDAWTFILVSLGTDSKRTTIQEKLFPGSTPIVHAVEAFVDWQDAVYECVMHAASTSWSTKIVQDMKQEEQ